MVYSHDAVIVLISEKNKKMKKKKLRKSQRTLSKVDGLRLETDSRKVINEWTFLFHNKRIMLMFFFLLIVR